MRFPVCEVLPPRSHCHSRAGLALFVGAEPRRKKTRASFRQLIFRSYFPVTSRRWAQHFWPEEHSRKTTAPLIKICWSLIRHSRRKHFQSSRQLVNGSCIAFAHLRLNGEK